MLALTLLVLAQSAPPLLPADAPLATSAAPTRRKAPATLPPVRAALHFSPLSLFSLTLAVEGEVHLTHGLTFFLGGGFGALGQSGGDVGLRWYVLGDPLERFFVDVHGSLFALWYGGPQVLAGGGVTLGHAWRLGHLSLTLGAGFTTWRTLARGGPGLANGAALFTTADTELVIFPGPQQPPQNLPGVQPTVRFTLGPNFLDP